VAKDYHLVPSKVFLKDLTKIPFDIRPKVEKAVLELKKDPHRHGTLKNSITLTSAHIGSESVISDCDKMSPTTT